MEFEDRDGPHGKGGWTVQLGTKQVGDFRSGQMRMARDDQTCYIARPHFHKQKRKFGMVILKVTTKDLPIGKERLRWQNIPQHSFHEGLQRIDSFIVSGDRAYVAAEGFGDPHPWRKDLKIERQLKGSPCPGLLSVIDLKTGREITRLALDAAVINNGLAVAGGKLFAVCEDGTIRCYSDSP